MNFFRLDKPVQFLKGVGPVRAEALGRMGIVTARDLLYHVPRRYDDASTIEPIEKLQVGADVTAVGRVRSKGVIPTRTGLRIFQAVLQDDSGMITCAWPGQPWLERKLHEGDLLLVTGPVKFFHGRQLQPREFTVLARAEEDSPAQVAQGHVFSTYPASEEVQQWVLRGLFDKNLDVLLKEVAEEEYLTGKERSELVLPGLEDALGELHRPSSLGAVETARRRLAFDELFFLQLVQAQARYQETILKLGLVFERTNEFIRPLHEALPFELTGAQARVLREIYADMGSDRRMNRLLQGDVGSGKTIVALFAMLLAAESGRQAVLMAPTELLAEQHVRKLSELVEPLGLSVQVLTGQLKASERKAVLRALSDGTAVLTVGTHALIQDNVEFRDLGLVVVDEQHRFGVRQRMALGEREIPPDTLIMSATPIPRSLAMTLYGDLDLSLLDEMPKGRKPVKTLLRYPSKRAQVHHLVDEELEAGRQAYIVYPLVEESDKMDLQSATEEYERLSAETFQHRRVGLIHGQRSSEGKDDVMRAFLAGDIDVLVATTVIEVGIDVPNASVMVVEHAERFGLSQLHQLRGRVGRGAAKSYCILIAEPGEAAAERLKIFRDTSDGFALAHADLRIRGQGDLFGAQQHGRDPVLRFADLTRDEGLLLEAQARARALVKSDPELSSDGVARIRALMDHRYAERLKLFSVG
ncbi:MAG: ATP-dependent DNA helicase RecG [Gemmatimonadota bacterium]|nr:ATP-dependent DNA helicase RecG [Gemmatimonadota bacterium]